MALIKVIKRQISSSTDELAKKINRIPWNFNSHYRHKEVQSLELPVDMNKVIPLSGQATSIFKNYVDGI